MTIEKLLNGASARIVIAGRLDTQTAPDLEKEIDGVVSNLKELTLDMAGLEYVSSAGLRVILKTQKMRHKNTSLYFWFLWYFCFAALNILHQAHFYL